MKQISVVISSYNQSVTILQSIHFLQEEALINRYELEIIICDDGSDKYHLKALVTGLQQVTCPVRLIWQRDISFRLAASRNNGLRLANYPIIVFIDGDCIPCQGFLTAHIASHNQYYSAISVGKRFYASEKQDDANCLREKTAKEEYDIKQRLCSSHPWEAVLGRNFSISQPPPGVFFDETLLGWGLEDLDFSISCHHSGLRNISYLPEAAVTEYHNPAESRNPFLASSPQNTLYAICNALWLLKKYEQNDKLYAKLAFYLYQYTFPFEFTPHGILYHSEKAEYFYQHARQVIPKNVVDIRKYHKEITIQISALFLLYNDIPLHPYQKRNRVQKTSTTTVKNFSIPFKQLLAGAANFPYENYVLIYFANQEDLEKLLAAHVDALDSPLLLDHNMDLLFLYDFRTGEKTVDIECLYRSKQFCNITLPN